jgi:hypothetical protein
MTETDRSRSVSFVLDDRVFVLRPTLRQLDSLRRSNHGRDRMARMKL